MAGMCGVVKSVTYGVWLRRILCKSPQTTFRWEKTTSWGLRLGAHARKGCAKKRLKAVRNRLVLSHCGSNGFLRKGPLVPKVHQGRQHVVCGRSRLDRVRRGCHILQL